MEADDLLKAIGGRGRFQILVYISLCLVYMRGAWHAFAIMFLGGNPGYQCRTEPSLGNRTFPDGECKLLVEKNGVNISESCVYGMEYGNENFDSTILTEFDLVCNLDYLVDLSSTIYMVGSALGAVIITPFSDRFGRKWVLLLMLWLQGVIGVCVIFSGSYAVFTTLRFFVGALNMAIALIAYVMITEVFPSEIRTLTVSTSFFWSAGVISFAVFGYFVRDWKYFELLITLPNFLTLIYIWTLPESIPWMYTNKKVKQLKETLKRAARMNRIDLPDDLLSNVDDLSSNQKANHPAPRQGSEVNLTPSGEIQTTVVSEDGQPGQSRHPGQDKVTILDLFRTSKMRRYTLIMFYLWFVNSLGYFGTMFSTPMLHGNMFLNLGLSGAVEIPAIVICILVLERVGRRRPLVFFMLLCGVMNTAAIFVPEKTASGTDLGPLIITLAMIGKFGITGSYSTVYLMSAEIFPTIVRNQAVGLSSFCENTGSIAAPFIVYGAKNLSQMPLVLFGVLTIIGGILAIFLPETHKQALPETIEDVETRRSTPGRSYKPPVTPSDDYGMWESSKCQILATRTTQTPSQQPVSGCNPLGLTDRSHAGNYDLENETLKM